MEFAVYASENWHIKDRYLELKKLAGKFEGYERR
jgi:hypothetical protein